MAMSNGGFDSRDCVNIIIDDGPSDTPPRPASPERRARLQAEKERLERLLEQARKESGNPNLTWQPCDAIVILDDDAGQSSPPG